MSYLKKIFFLRGKDLLFCIAIIATLLLIYNIPVKLLFQEFVNQAIAKDLRIITVCIISILFCCFVAKKYVGGISNWEKTHSRTNYWMLLIPLLFPGVLNYSKFSITCYESFSAGFIVTFIYLLGGIAEEVAFRGLIQGYLTKNYPEKSNHQICFLTAFFFAIIHFNNIQQLVLGSVLNQVVYAFFMGLLFSALMIRTGNVWLLGISHGLLNFISSSCSTADRNTTISDNVVAGSLIEHLAQIGGMILVFSPALLIYWLLLKATPERMPDNN